ncbi:unnamed protein product [Closterium sp. NIES-54]
MAAAKRVLRYLCSTSGLGLVLGGRRPLVLTGHADASWADDQATQRSSKGYTFSLASGSVSWRSTRSSSVLGSSCVAEIYAGAMAAQELRWLTYLLTDLGEPPRSPPVLYVDNKAMLALCLEHRLEHWTKHIALRYFLARELQQRGQLRLAYVASEANTADIFTKALPPGDHQRFCTMLALTCATAATAAPAATAASATTATTLATAHTATMASPTVLTFDAEGRAVDFDVWVDDLQLFLQCDSRDGVSLFDHTSGVSTAPAATADSTVRSQWTTHDDVARLVVCSHLPPAERAHFGQYKTAQSLYDAVVARYSSLATAALSRLMLPYLFPDLAAFATVADLVAHLCASDARYRAALPTEDHFLSLCPTELTVDLLEERLTAAEKIILAVGASRGDHRTPFFEGCSLVPLLPSVASAAAVDLVGTEEVGAASAPSGRRRTSKGKGSKVGGGGGGRSSGGGGGGGEGGGGGGGGTGSGGVSGGGGGRGGGGEEVEAAAAVVEVAAEVVLVEVRLRSVEALVAASASSSSASVRHRRFSSFVSGTQGVGGLGVQVPALTFFAPALVVGRCFPDAVELPRWHDPLLQNVPIFDLDFDAILAAMYALADSAKGDCYLSVPPDPGIAAAALGASASAAPDTSASATPGAGAFALSGTAPTESLHTFTLDSGASHSFLETAPCSCRSFTPGGQRVTHCTCSRTGRHLATFTRRPGSSLYTLTTAPPPVPASGQVAASSQVFAVASRSSPASAPCSCRPLAHEALLWHHRLGHPSLPRLRGMASRALISGLPRSLPPLPPGPAPTCVPCFVGRQRAAPHSSSFPPTEAPLQTLHMDVWGPACVRGQGHERYFLLVVDDYSRYTTVFPLRSKGEVPEVLIDWIGAARRQLSEIFGSDLPVLRRHSDRGGEFSSDLLRAFCRSEGIRQTLTLPASPQQNGIAERRIGMVTDVARTSMIHAATPHFQWPFAVRYAAHQINLQPCVSLPETTLTLWWMGKVGDGSAFHVWGSRAFVRDTTADKLSSRAVPYVFLGFPPDAPGWQFYHPTSPSLSLPHCLSPPTAALPGTSTAFLQGSLHEEIWLRRPPGFTGSSPAGTQWSLRRPVYGLCQAPHEWHDTLRTTLAALGFGPSTSDPSLYLRTDTTLPPFYVLMYVDDLVFATADTEALAHVNTSGMGLVLGGLARVVLTGHADASSVDDLATQRSSQGYTFSLGSGFVSWRSTRSSSVLSSSCEAEIYTGAMAAQELRWLTYLLTDLGEAPRSPPVLYVDNKAMLALCQEHRLEHRTKHIALHYFLARELQQHGQLCLAYVASPANTADVFTKAL